MTLEPGPPQLEDAQGNLYDTLSDTWHKLPGLPGPSSASDVEIANCNHGNSICTAISDECVYIWAQPHLVVCSLNPDNQRWKYFRLTTADGNTMPFFSFHAESMAVAAGTVNEVSFLGWRPELGTEGPSGDISHVITVSTFRLAPSLDAVLPTTNLRRRLLREPVPFALADQIPATIRSLEDIWYCRFHYVDGEPLVLELSGGVWQRTGKHVRYLGGFKGHPKGPLWWSSLLPIPALSRKQSDT